MSGILQVTSKGTIQATYNEAESTKCGSTPTRLEDMT